MATTGGAKLAYRPDSQPHGNGGRNSALFVTRDILEVVRQLREPHASLHVAV
jgi:hypothetical protein